MPGAPPLEPRELLRAEDRVSFLYLEHAVVHRDSNAITSTDARGTVHIPSATIATLLLGPGTSISHHAVMLLAESGANVVWVGERGVRYYAHGRPLARSSRLLDAQARLVSNRQSRLAVAREMYTMRFVGEDTRGLTMQQLRGREGARVKRTYREHSERTGVAWRSRSYVAGDFEKSDAVNKALSAANTAMYGAVHSVVVALGCSPGLGFVHTGHDRSFVYDIADLYKADLVIPTAFDVAAKEGVEDIGAHTRRTMRDVIFRAKLLERCVADVRRLLLGDTGSGGEEIDMVSLWDDRADAVAAGQNYDEVDW
ncbi:MAG: type I-E CRISPR-associated endonuclease Cas1 [Kineosporiaceae bacterium]|nr:type I-E CRISPR-associated endonuclease Cas1 [Kineosporiaceae bacterium]